MVDSLQAAIEYARQGLLVVPNYGIEPEYLLNGGIAACTCGNPDCPTPGKHPILRDGVYGASLEARKVKRWNQYWRNGANVGIATGRGLLVLDIDDLAALPALEEQYGPLPRNWSVRSGSGGLHIYLTVPTDIEYKNSTKWKPGMDIRSYGIQVIAPPSRHVTGGTYEWLSRDGTSPPACPSSWLIELPIADATRQPDTDKPKTDLLATYEKYTANRSTGSNDNDTWDNQVVSNGIENTEIAETIETIETFSITFQLQEDVKQRIYAAIDAARLTAPGQGYKNAGIMDVARRLKAIPELEELDAEDLEPLFRRWFNLSKRFVEKPNYQAALDKWVYVWDWVEINIESDTVYQSFQRVLSNPLPAICDKYKSRQKRQLLAVCRDLELHKKHDAWFISCDKASRIMGIAPMNVWRWLRHFELEGLLEVVERGSTETRRATRYRYIGDDIQRQVAA